MLGLPLRMCVANVRTANAEGFNQFSSSLQPFLEAEFPRAWLTSTRADQSIASKLEALGLTNAELVRGSGEAAQINAKAVLRAC